MKKNIFKGLALTGVLMLSTVSFAQDAPETTEEKKPIFSGSLDMYSKFGYKNGFTSFTRSQGSLELGMASIRADHQIGKVGAVIDLGFGQRVEEFVGRPGTNTNLAIKQAYLTYEVIDKLTLIGGTFGTHIGYELLDAASNKNYSMSYAFSNGPFYSTGLKANYQITDVFSAMLGVTLPTNSRTVTESGSTQKAIIGQLGYVKDDTSVYLNFSNESTNPMYQNIMQVDVVASHKISDELNLGLNVTYQSIADDRTGMTPWDKSLPMYKEASWYSIVVYAGYKLKDNMSLNYRLEKLGSSKSQEYSILGMDINNRGVHVIANTLSFNYKVGNLTIIPEIRSDIANKGIFGGSSGSKINGSALLAAAYTF